MAEPVVRAKSEARASNVVVAWIGALISVAGSVVSLMNADSSRRSANAAEAQLKLKIAESSPNVQVIAYADPNASDFRLEIKLVNDGVPLAISAIGIEVPSTQSGQFRYLPLRVPGLKLPLLMEKGTVFQGFLTADSVDGLSEQAKREAIGIIVDTTRGVQFRAAMNTDIRRLLDANR